MHPAQNQLISFKWQKLEKCLGPVKRINMASESSTSREETKDTLGYQVFVIEALVDTFIAYLVPSEVIEMIGIEETRKEVIIQTESEDRPEAVRMLLKEVMKEPADHVSLFVYALRMNGFERFIDILDDKEENKDEKKAAEKYELMLQMLRGDLIKRIIPSAIIDDLVPLLGPGDHEKILVKEETSGPIPACRELFFCMKRKTKNWPLKFLEVLHNNLPGLPAKIDPTLESGGTETTDLDMTSESDADSYTEALSDEEKQDYEDREKDKRPRKLGERANLNMRNYQLELAERAIDGENTVVFAPTGSGKTRVAIYILMTILDKITEANRRKVLFLEPTVILVEQTYKAVYHFLGKDYKITKVTGNDETSVSLHTLLPINDIIVMTPKILDNHLEDGRISSVSGLCRLLILDECHHTRKEEVYNKVMIRYLKEKESGAAELPQILGLTATLGVEKAMTVEDGVTNVLKFLGNLDTPIITKVERHVEELKRLVAVPKEETISLVMNQDSPSQRIILAAMARAEEYLSVLTALEEDAVNKLITRANDGMDRSSQMYNQWTVFLKEAAGKVNTRDDPARTELIRDLNVIAEHLYNYNVALTLAENIRVKDVIVYLTRELTPSDGAMECTTCELQLREIGKGTLEALTSEERKRQEDKAYENPRLTQLSEILQDSIEEVQGDPRIIVFARTRLMCGALAEWLRKDNHIPQTLKDLRADVLTGQDEGMTKADQESVISKFSNGTVKLIVSTTVGHEGLDISDCSIVIAFNDVGNEISMVQKRGRSRKAGGKSVLLASSKHQQKQEQNAHRIYIMNKAVTKIVDMPSSDVKAEIKRYQKEALAIEEAKELNRSMNILKVKDIDFTLECKRCRNVCITGSTLRVINNAHRITVDKEVRDTKIKITKSADPERIDHVSIVGSVRCKNCDQPWGTWLIYQKVQYPSLKIKNFCLKSTEVEGPQLFKKWKKCPYTIRPLLTEETVLYLRSNEDSDISDDD